jgi:uncharacterized protein
VKLATWFYKPASTVPSPAIVMAHGFGGVKEQNLDKFAETFCDAGFAVLVFDHRGFGASGGTTRQEADPWIQVRDYRLAITALTLRSDVDKARIGIWGTSHAGGHVLVTAAIDRRVKVVVSQIPAISGHGTLERRSPEIITNMRSAFVIDRNARFAGQLPQTIQIYPVDEKQPAAMPSTDALAHYRNSLDETNAPLWKNE